MYFIGQDIILLPHRLGRTRQDLNIKFNLIGRSKISTIHFSEILTKIKRVKTNLNVYKSTDNFRHGHKMN